MRTLFVFLICSAHLFPASAQESIPDSVTYNAAAMGTWVQNLQETDLVKYRLIYHWVTANITYNTDSAYAINFGMDKKDMVSAVLRRRAGVCENYAALYDEVCDQAGLTSFIVRGYTRQLGEVDRSAHCWNAVNLHGNWFLCDPTWGVGNADKYFMVPAARMIFTHMPFDPMWQLLTYPINPDEFSNGRTGSTKTKTVFRFEDSIHVYQNLDSLGRLENAARRIMTVSKTSPLAFLNEKVNNMDIEMMKQDRDVDAYNRAVKIINECKKEYNAFVSYRNSFFLPVEQLENTYNRLGGIDAGLQKAGKFLQEIAESETHYRFDIEDLEMGIRSLQDKLKQQFNFLELYKNAAAKDREKLFYK